MTETFFSLYIDNDNKNMFTCLWAWPLSSNIIIVYKSININIVQIFKYMTIKFFYISNISRNTCSYTHILTCTTHMHSYKHHRFTLTIIHVLLHTLASTYSITPLILKYTHPNLSTHIFATLIISWTHSHTHIYSLTYTHNSHIHSTYSPHTTVALLPHRLTLHRADLK